MGSCKRFAAILVTTLALSLSYQAQAIVVRLPAQNNFFHELPVVNLQNLRVDK